MREGGRLYASQVEGGREGRKEGRREGRKEGRKEGGERVLRDLCVLVEGSVTPKAFISWFVRNTRDSDFGVACS